MARKTPSLDDFRKYYELLRAQVVEKAYRLPDSQIDMKIDALKVATASISVENRSPGDDEGEEIRAMRQELESPANTDELLEETPEPDEYAA